MSDEELVELITDNLGFSCSDYCDRFLPGCAHTCGGADKKIALNWLQSEAGQRCLYDKCRENQKHV